MDYADTIIVVHHGIQDMQKKLSQCQKFVDWEDLKARRKAVRLEVEKDNLWDNPEYARKQTMLLSELDNLYDKIETYLDITQTSTELLAILRQEEDEELMQDLKESVQKAAKEVHALSYEVMLNEPEDKGSCYVYVQSGAGGTDAQDWAEMLYTMYLRWGQSQGHKVIVEDYMEGEEAGIKGATLRIEGSYVFGFLKAESGIHRLVRQSPYNASGKRHTSFASVLVLPVVSDTITVVVEEKDLRVDTYRASGAGGQHVNKTDSAVRITHIPTGIVVQCQSDRSQHRNKDSAMKMLVSRLYALQLEEKKAKESQIEKDSISWGHQIRSYVLHPYCLVKDLRTQVEHQDPGKVLQGDINRFLEAALSQKINIKS